MPNSLTAEAHVNPSGHGEIRHITIGTLCRASYKLRAVRRFEKQAGVFGLADGALIDQQHRPTVVTNLVGAWQSLQKCCHLFRIEQLAVWKIWRHRVAALKHRSHHIGFVRQPGRDLPRGSLRVTAIIENYGRTVLELLEHLVYLWHGQAV